MKKMNNNIKSYLIQCVEDLYLASCITETEKESIKWVIGNKK